MPRSSQEHLALALLRGLAVAVLLVAAVVGLALGLGEAVVGVGGLVTQVGVDAHELTTVDGGNTLHVHGTGAVVLAVTAAAVDLAVVLGVEVDDVDVATTVVLDDLVVGTESATTNNVGNTVALDRDGVLADVLEPDKLKVARALAVNTLLLVGTNDNVAQSGAILENEDGVLLA